MDIMNEFPEMNWVFIVMDNAPINVPEIINPMIKKRGYTPVYLPACSSELNPIEQFWAVLKGKVKRSFIVFFFVSLTQTAYCLFLSLCLYKKHNYL